MERIEILDLAFQFVKRIDQRAQTRDFIDIGLGALAIVPKIGAGHSRFERGQFFLQFGQVKETSAARARETSNRRRQRWKFQLAWGKQYAAPLICHVERSRDISRYFRADSLSSTEIVRDSSTSVGMTESKITAARNLCACPLGPQPIRLGKSFRHPSSNRAGRARSFPNKPDQS